MTSFRGQASKAKMMSPGGKLRVLVFHPSKKVNKAEELTCLSTNIGIMHSSLVGQRVRDDKKKFL
jgi:hypothetical protein